ncbi:MAG: hypothetical protein WCQ65_09970 [Fermentimonas sp.]
MDIRFLVSSGYDLFCGPCTTSGTTCSGVTGGYIAIEPGFQMVSIPITHGYWSSIIHGHVHDNSTIANVHNYIVQQIEDLHGVSANTMIEVFNTLVGGQGNYWNFVPGVTNPDSPHNFQLAYLDTDVGTYEYIGFFIKSIHSTTFTIQWGDI